MSELLVEYKEHLRDVRELKPRTISTTMMRLEWLLMDIEWSDEADEMAAQSAVDYYRTKRAVDTVRGAVNCAGALWDWLKDRGLAHSNPWRAVKVHGRRRRGKKQLTGTESRAVIDRCLAEGSGHAGAVLCALLLGLRASEIAGIEGRDIDADRLWVRGTKTDHAERVVEVPDVLAPLLPLVASTTMTRYTVAYHCERLAGVGPQALRGTHATLARSAGATSELVAKQLGHGSTGVTERHYIAPGASEAATRRAALKVLVGGAAQ